MPNKPTIAKPKKCRHCKMTFQPWNSLQVCCSPRCAVGYTTEKKAKLERKRTRQAKEKLKTVSDLIKETQQAFNAYIRWRDRDLPCISCGRHDHEIREYLRGGKWDCGHYLSVGSHPELRFEESNAAKQCKSCNGGSGKYAKKNHTVSQSYRKNLIERIGQEKVDWLEGPHEPKKYRHDDLRELKSYYRKLVREAA